jgi:hypothetical protein
MMARLLVFASLLWVAVVAVAVPRAQEPVPARSSAHPADSLFTRADDCVACHNNLVTPSGEDVSIGTAWRSTMMANSARDPYWQAAVRRETLDHPTHAAAIADECALCHMPMATRVARAAGAQGEVFAHLPIAEGTTERSHLAADGVSCTVCHQIQPDRLGQRDSFNGEFSIAPLSPGTPRTIFGPYAIDAGRRTIMRSVTSFEQTEGAHVRQSALCASCHTLITTAFGPGGEVVGTLPEQMNYQEWEHSDHAREGRSCQSCHMPKAPGPLRTASVLGEPRESLARHSFGGGNAFMLRLLNRYRTELGVEASPAELEATAQATLRQLRDETATVTVSALSRTADVLSFAVGITVLTGHKYPTGYPARRTWLHVLVRDAEGRALFESGRIDASGAIAGNDADADAGRFEPHYREITRPDQVQIYETILGDPRGRVTTGLLTATQYLKDNRLLPRGFNKATANAEIGVYGDASGDSDFVGGSDRIVYRLPVGTSGPVRVEVELRYQPVAYRWAHNLGAYDAPEPKRFVSYYTAMSEVASTRVASASLLIP